MRTFIDLRYLNNFMTPLSIASDRTCHYKHAVSSIIDDLFCSSHLPISTSNLIFSTPSTPTIYFIPQIHKPNNTGSPIVFIRNCPTELISKYLERVLSPILATLLSHIHYTNRALCFFNSFTLPSHSSELLFTMDIKNL